MELKSVNKLEKANNLIRPESFRMGVALLFIVGILIYTGAKATGVDSHLLIAAAVIGGYMAMNIGANDVANNVGPAVGSAALTMTGAIIIAMIFESAGALIAGGDVVGTIKKGIINPEMIPDAQTFVWLMLAALLAGAIWLNIATSVGAPVSTTHSIVGGVLGAGIAAGGLGIADWGKMGQIAASWVISPVMGGAIAALFLFTIKRTITYRKDKIAAAQRMVPIFVSLMVWAFSTYLILKGLKKIWKTDLLTAMGIGLAIAVVTYIIVKPWLKKVSQGAENNKDSVNKMFTWPLVFAAALLSFAHGANDVANAVGPLAAINDAILHGGVSTKAAIPTWVMVVGALGISLGLALYGPKLIKTVGSEITELDKMRAYCIAMAAAITVIIASQLGLPVSSTHIAVGGIFGVGFLREYIKSNYASTVEEVKAHHHGADQAEVEAYLDEFNKASIAQKGIMLQELKNKSKRQGLSKAERKRLKKAYKHDLVKRSAFRRIIAAWLITVPASGMIAAVLFFTIRGMMLP